MDFDSCAHLRNAGGIANGAGYLARTAGSIGGQSRREHPQQHHRDPCWPRIHAYHSTLAGDLLFDGKIRRRRDHLLRDIIVHLNGQTVDSCRQRRQRHTLFEGELLADVAHLVSGFLNVRHLLVGGGIDHVVFDSGRRFFALVVNAQVVHLHPEIHLLVALEAGRLAVGWRHARANLGGSDDEIASAYAFGGDFFHLVRQNQRAGSELIVGEFGNAEWMRPGTDAVAFHVFDDQIHFVTAGTQRQRLPVHRGIFQGLGQQLAGHIYLNRIFKGLRYAVGQSCDPAKNVHQPALHFILFLKGNVPVLDLDSDGNQNRIGGNFHEVGPHVERHEVVADVAADYLFQILELHCRGTLQSGKLGNAIKLGGLVLLGEAADGAEFFYSALHKAVRFASQPHLFHKSKAGIGGVEQSVFFGAVDSHVIVAAHAAIYEFDDDLIAHPLQVAIAPLLEGKRSS